MNPLSRHAAALALVGWYLMMPMVQKKKLVETASPAMGAKRRNQTADNYTILPASIALIVKHRYRSG
jgi:hypothetical protein